MRPAEADAPEAAYVALVNAPIRIDPVFRGMPGDVAMECYWRAVHGLDHGALIEDYKTLRAILFANQDLSEDGVGAVGWGSTPAESCDQFSCARMRMLRPHLLDQFRAARQWLKRFPKTKRASRRGTSYGLKHAAERRIGYLTNGCLIAAAIAEGFRVERIEGTPNARIGVRRAAWR